MHVFPFKDVQVSFSKPHTPRKGKTISNRRMLKGLMEVQETPGVLPLAVIIAR